MVYTLGIKLVVAYTDMYVTGYEVGVVVVADKKRCIIRTVVWSMM